MLKYQRIRGLREDRDLKQSTVAQYLNIKQNSYSYYEREERNMPIEVFMKLALYYSTSVDYLIGLTDEERPYPRAKKRK
ncbi:MAG: helix-turn-helix domain-containing protein [Oscillospiraceae bacterium]|nr:helix-turn-helix domain-containing protein [Oscillospiraceae bacterium]